MSWKGNYWGTGGALEIAEHRFLESSQSPQEMIAYASVKHSAAGRALAECKRGRIWYLKRGVDLGAQALGLVKLAWQGLDNQVGLSHDYNALDVSCAIWRRWGWLEGGKKDLARIHLTRVKWGELSTDELVKAHTRAFLIVHALALNLAEKADWYDKLCELAKETEEQGEKNQAGRIWKYIAELFSDASARARALELAGSDQRAKMGV